MKKKRRMGEIRTERKGWKVKKRKRGGNKNE
jgi:hypothetical protein